MFIDLERYYRGWIIEGKVKAAAETEKAVASRFSAGDILRYLKLLKALKLIAAYRWVSRSRDWTLFSVYSRIRHRRDKAWIIFGYAARETVETAYRKAQKQRLLEQGIPGVTTQTPRKMITKLSQKHLSEFHAIDCYYVAMAKTDNVHGIGVTWSVNPETQEPDIRIVDGGVENVRQFSADNFVKACAMPFHVYEFDLE